MARFGAAVGVVLLLAPAAAFPAQENAVQVSGPLRDRLAVGDTVRLAVPGNLKVEGRIAVIDEKNLTLVQQGGVLFKVEREQILGVEVSRLQTRSVGARQGALLGGGVALASLAIGYGLQARQPEGSCSSQLSQQSFECLKGTDLVVGTVLGAAIGAAIGAIFPGHHYVRLSTGDVRVSLAAIPVRGRGVALRATLRF